MTKRKKKDNKKNGSSRSRAGKDPIWSHHEGSLGLVHIYTGDGKGKTTAAVGLIIRAHGQGLRCCFIQFMKGRFPYGEVKVLRDLKGVTVRQFGTLEFVRKGKQRDMDVAEANKAMEYSKRILKSKRYDLVILDEICVAGFMELVPLNDIIDLVRSRSTGVELVLTGRKAHERLLKVADYVTRFEKDVHPFDRGIIARKGIEY